MSSSIWTRCAGGSEIGPLRLAPWRAVESQHQVSTRKLVVTLAEQELLEELIGAAKPPDPTLGKLHYLLATPFRYPPLPRGSRFGVRHERGIWYGADTLPAAMAEVAYYRLVFLEGTTADIPVLTAEITVFSARVHTQRGIDLMLPPFDAFRSVIASRTDYGATQALGAAMRDAGVEAFRYPSARDPRGGSNIGVLSPAAFGRAQPRAFTTWWCTTTRERVEIVRRDWFERDAFVFERREFLVRGRLPVPAM